MADIKNIYFKLAYTQQIRNIAYNDHNLHKEYTTLLS